MKRLLALLCLPLTGCGYVGVYSATHGLGDAYIYQYHAAPLDNAETQLTVISTPLSVGDSGLENQLKRYAREEASRQNCNGYTLNKITFGQLNTAWDGRRYARGILRCTTVDIPSYLLEQAQTQAPGTVQVMPAEAAPAIDATPAPKATAKTKASKKPQKTKAENTNTEKPTTNQLDLPSSDVAVGGIDSQREIRPEELQAPRPALSPTEILTPTAAANAGLPKIGGIDEQHAVDMNAALKPPIPPLAAADILVGTETPRQPAPAQAASLSSQDILKAADTETPLVGGIDSRRQPESTDLTPPRPSLNKKGILAGVSGEPANQSLSSQDILSDIETKPTSMNKNDILSDLPKSKATGSTKTSTANKKSGH